MLCPNCRNEFPNDSLFCPVCGERQRAAVQSEQQRAAMRAHSTEEFRIAFEDAPSDKPVRRSKKPIAVFLLLLFLLFAACSAFSLLTGFRVLPDYLNLEKATTVQAAPETQSSADVQA